MMGSSDASGKRPAHQERPVTIATTLRRLRMQGGTWQMMPATNSLPRTLGELRQSRFSEERHAHRTVKDEIRENLICRLQRKEPLFPGIVGYEETVGPQVVNALLSRHN